jgi:hypothetical protein
MRRELSNNSMQRTALRAAADAERYTGGTRSGDRDTAELQGLEDAWIRFPPQEEGLPLASATRRPVCAHGDPVLVALESNLSEQP